MKFQVFKQAGRTVGQGAVVAGGDWVVVETAGADEAGPETWAAELDEPGTTTADEPGTTADEVSAAVTGQTVVEMATVRVVRTVEWAGQFVTVAAQLVMVDTIVVKTVEVVYWIGLVAAGEVTAEDDTTVAEVKAEDDTMVAEVKAEDDGATIGVVVLV